MLWVSCVFTVQAVMLLSSEWEIFPSHFHPFHSLSSAFFFCTILLKGTVQPKMNISIVIKLFKFTLPDVISDIFPPVGHKRRNLKNQHVVLFHITTLWPWLSSSNKGTTKVVYMTFALYSESLEDFQWTTEHLAPLFHIERVNAYEYSCTFRCMRCNSSCCTVWALLTVR